MKYELTAALAALLFGVAACGSNDIPEDTTSDEVTVVEKVETETLDGFTELCVGDNGLPIEGCQEP